MDTHIAPHPDIEPGIAVMSARLPGEADSPLSGDAGPELGERRPSSALGSAPRRRRRWLVGCGAAGLALGAGGAFLASPYNDVYPVPGLRASASSVVHAAENKLQPILAPSAQLATVSVPPSPPATFGRYVLKPRDQQVAELLSLHPDVTNQPTATAPAASAPAGSAHVGGASAKAAAQPPGAMPSPPAIPTEPGMPHAYSPHPPSSPGAAAVVVQPTASTASPLPTEQSAPKDTPETPPQTGQAVLAAAAGQVVAGEPGAVLAPPGAAAPRPASDAVAAAPSRTPALPAAPPSPPPAVAPPGSDAVADPHPVADHAPLTPAKPLHDPLVVAATLRAGPMTPAEQVDVLNLVTQLATMVKDLRKGQLQQRTDLDKAAADVTSQLNDFRRRLVLAEARDAMAEARDPSASANVQPVGDAAAVSLKAAPVAMTRSAPAASAPAVPPVPKLYRVQAASPGLALLAEVDRGGGEGAQMQVVVGDTVPDYGRVKWIAQRGTAWIVSTEHGEIQ